jgi:acetylornithine deacetylase/succinyl-diaminopimelate desuccinylase-like protein
MSAIYQRPAELSQNLIRFNTTNPPGDEAACVNYIQQLLQEAGIESKIYARDPYRPNLVARLKGRGDAPPLLLQGHVDVVTTENQKWTHPPFEAKIVDGFIWGRGALDMKGAVAMMLSAFLRAKIENANLPGDVILTILSDEEAGGNFGAKYLVENHADLFKDVRYALGEFGGFNLQIGKQSFYPIMIAEKQICWLKIILRGPAGHGSMPIRGGAMAKLGRVLARLDQNLLPVHITPSARAMVQGIVEGSPLFNRMLLSQLLNPLFTDRILNLLGERGKLFVPLFRNTVNATLVRGGDKINVIPSEIMIELDGRMLPGFNPEDMIREVRDVIGDEGEIEMVRHDPGPAEPNMGLFDTLVRALREMDSTALPIPLLLVAVTDARFFSRLGIQTYGFTPMQLPPDMNFSQTIHAADERIPVEAVGFGAEAIFKVLRSFK